VGPAQYQWLSTSFGGSLSLPAGPMLARTRVALRAGSSVRSAAAAAAGASPTSSVPLSAAAAAQPMGGAWSPPLLGATARTSAAMTLVRLRPLANDLHVTLAGAGSTANATVLSSPACVALAAPRTFLGQASATMASTYASVTASSASVAVAPGATTPAWQVGGAGASGVAPLGLVVQLPDWSSASGLPATLEAWRTATLPAALRAGPYPFGPQTSFASSAPTGSEQLALSCTLAGGLAGGSLRLAGMLTATSASAAATEFAASSSQLLSSTFDASGWSFSPALPAGAWAAPAYDNASLVVGWTTAAAVPPVSTASALLLAYTPGANTGSGAGGGGAGVATDGVQCSLVLQLPVAWLAARLALGGTTASDTTAALQTVQASLVPFASGTTVASSATSSSSSSSSAAPSAAGLGVAIDTVGMHLVAEPNPTAGATLQLDPAVVAAAAGGGLLAGLTAWAAPAGSATVLVAGAGTGAASNGAVGTSPGNVNGTTPQFAFGASGGSMVYTTAFAAASGVGAEGSRTSTTASAFFGAASTCGWSSSSAVSMAATALPAFASATAAGAPSVAAAAAAQLWWAPYWAAWQPLPLLLPAPLNPDAVWTLELVAPVTSSMGFQLLSSSSSASSSSAAMLAAALAVVSFSPPLLPAVAWAGAALGAMPSVNLNAGVCAEAAQWLAADLAGTSM
jgi:hypothetical protein